MMKIFLILISLLEISSKSCLILFTGGSNFINPKLYSNFLTSINLDIYKIPFKENILNKNFYKYLENEYDDINILAHSSGCVTALNNCNPSIKKMILLDPVKTPNYNYNDLNSLEGIFILNAGKSYKWSIFPPFLPFIPAFRILDKDLNIDKSKILKLTIKNYGHADIINRPWRDLMHYSRLSLGGENRTNIEFYHNLLIFFIISYLDF